MTTERRPGSRLLRVLLRVAAAFAVVLVLGVLAIWLWGERALCAVGARAAGDALGAPVTIGSVRWDWRGGSIAVRNTVVSNPPGFGPGVMLDMPEFRISANPDGGIAELKIDLARLGVVIDPAGRTNWMAGRAFTKLSKKKPNKNGSGDKEDSGMPTLPHIDKLIVSLGKLHFDDQRLSKGARDVEFGIHDFAVTNISTLGDLTPIAGMVLLKGAMGGILGR
jgi:hypothetical protein